MNHRYRTRIVPALLPATHLWQLLSLSFTFTQAFLPLAYRATPPSPDRWALCCWLLYKYKCAQLAFSIFIDDCAVPNLRKKEEGTQSADSEPRREPLTSYDLKHTRFACHHIKRPFPQFHHHHQINQLTHLNAQTNRQTHVCLWRLK